MAYTVIYLHRGGRKQNVRSALADNQSSLEQSPRSPDRDSYSAVSQDEDDMCIESSWSPCLYSLQMKAPTAVPLRCTNQIDIPHPFAKPGYHGLIPKAEAIELLWLQEDGTYLVRQTSSGKIIVSFCFNGTVHNCTVQYNGSNFIYDEKEFKTVEELVNDSLIHLYIESHQDVTQTLSQGRKIKKHKNNCKRKFGRYGKQNKNSDGLYDSTDGISLSASDSSLTDIPPEEDHVLDPHNVIHKSATLSGQHTCQKNNYLAIPKLSAGLHRSKSTNDKSEFGAITSLMKNNLKETSSSTDNISSKECKTHSRSSSASSYEKMHNFVAWTYKLPTWCDICRHYMWGLVNQGYYCQDCGINMHKQCMETINIECIPNKKLIQRVFGIDLTALVMVEGNTIPSFLQHAVSTIEERSLCTEGLYRVSGSTPKLYDLKERLDEGEEIQWDEMLDVHVITGVVKLYFRELPMPLITYDIYPSLMQAMRDFPEEHTLCPILQQMFMFSLPKSHYDALYFFMKHLNKVTLHKDVNKMKSSNLAVVFAPTLMRAPDDDDIMNMVNLKYEQLLIERMITNVDSIFVDL